jgi:hypothetical protein
MHTKTKAYFDDVVSRSASAPVVPYGDSPGAESNRCHANCEALVAENSAFEVVRGWLVIGANYFCPHSVVREHATGRLIDITPDPSTAGPLRFVEHKGTEADFIILRQGRDGGFLHPPIDPADWLLAGGLSPEF